MLNYPMILMHKKVIRLLLFDRFHNSILIKFICIKALWNSCEIRRDFQQFLRAFLHVVLIVNIDLISYEFRDFWIKFFLSFYDHFFFSIVKIFLTGYFQLSLVFTNRRLLFQFLTMNANVFFRNTLHRKCSKVCKITK